MTRTWTDGKPYYCKVCGLGYGEIAACDEPDCELESEEDAAIRQRDYIAHAPRALSSPEGTK